MTTYLNKDAPLELNTGDAVALIRAIPFMSHPEIEVLTVRLGDHDHCFYSTGRPFASTMLRLGADVRLQNRVEQVRPDYRQSVLTFDDYLRRWYGTRAIEAATPSTAVDSDEVTALARKILLNVLWPRMPYTFGHGSLNFDIAISESIAPEPVDPDIIAVRGLLIDTLKPHLGTGHPLQLVDSTEHRTFLTGTAEQLITQIGAGHFDESDTFEMSMTTFKAGRDAERQDNERERMEAMTATPAVPDRLTITIDGPQGCGKTTMARFLSRMMPLHHREPYQRESFTLNPIIIDMGADGVNDASIAA